MKNALMLVATVALIAVGLNQLAPKEAEAAPKYQALIYANDGGSSVGSCVTSKFQTMQLQSLTGTQYCYRTATTSAGCTADCTTDWRPLKPTVANSDAGSGTLTTYKFDSEPIQMGNDLCICASALDAGNPALGMFLLTKNPTP